MRSHETLDATPQAVGRTRASPAEENENTKEMLPVIPERKRSISAEPDKTVFFNDPKRNEIQFIGTNYIRTSKYTILTFLPMNLLEQFRRVANIYFLLNAVIAAIPGVSPILPITAALPLIFVLSVAAIKDGFEDYQRHQQDDKANSMPCNVLRVGSQKPTTVRSQDVVVGDILIIKDKEEVVADALVLNSTLPESLVYIDTAMLDGETNLKSRRATRQMLSIAALQTLGGIAGLKGEIVIQKPEPSLSTWKGQMTLSGHDAIPLGIEQFLYRGSIVRDTGTTYAVVVYVGPVTKMFLNLKKKAPKSSVLDQKLNKLILAVFLTQQIFVTLMCGGAVWFNDSYHTGGWYLSTVRFEKTGAGLFFWKYLTFFVLISNFIPISLFVTLELCKAVQALFMMWDLNMYHTTPDGREQHCTPKTSNLNEQLSVVKYVFSDKTGTLTKNVMQYIGGTTAHYSPLADVDKLVLDAASAKYFTHLAVCNTALALPQENGTIQYQSVSPDEVALCDAAAKCGVILRERSQKLMTINVLGMDVEFEILSVLEFTADRKMMSIVLREKNTSDIVLFTKGADSNMEPNIVNYTDQINAELARFALMGFRTLLLGTRVIPPDEFAEWAQLYDRALCDMNDRETAVRNACLRLENSMDFAGITAIEDELQEQVPETIRMMLNAKIVVWMLTGDKRETAVNVGVSCGLVRPQVDVLVHIRKDDVVERLQEGLRHCRSGKPVCLCLDGESFRNIEKFHKDPFMEVGLIVRCSVCCRLTPGQKATIVRFFQEHGESTLSIGDGANDVPMIQESYVGIGIMGLEGAQAELTSDYAVPRFKHLQRLLFVHGRYALYRNTMCVLYSLYKNACLALIQIIYSYYNGFSGQSFFDSWLLAIFNMVFCSFPPLSMGMFEKDIPEAVLLSDPTLYTSLALGQYMNPRILLAWTFETFVDGILIFFVSFATLLTDDHSPNTGRTTNIEIMGTMIMTTLIFTFNTRSILMIRTWTIIPAFALYFSYFLYFFSIFVYSSMDMMAGNSRFLDVGKELWGSVKTTLYILLFAVGWKTATTFALSAVHFNFFPTDSERRLKEYIGGR